MGKGVVKKQKIRKAFPGWGERVSIAKIMVEGLKDNFVREKHNHEVMEYVEKLNGDIYTAYRVSPKLLTNSKRRKK